MPTVENIVMALIRGIRGVLSACACYQQPGLTQALYTRFQRNDMPGDGLLDQIALLVAEERDRSSKAKAIAETIRAAGGYRWTGIYDVDIPNGLVSNVAWSGSGAPEHPTFPITKGLTSRAIAGKKTVNVGDVADDPDYLMAMSTTRSEIIIPVLDATGDRVLGTIDVESERLHAFDAAAQERLERCAKALSPFWTL